MDGSSITQQVDQSLTDFLEGQLTEESLQEVLDALDRRREARRGQPAPTRTALPPDAVDGRGSPMPANLNERQHGIPEGIG